MRPVASAPLCAIILAAGLGSRLGGRPKAAIEIGGRSILQRLAEALRGHPVLLSRTAVEGISVTPSGLGVRDWLAANPDAVGAMRSQEIAHVTDVDTPQDLIST